MLKKPTIYLSFLFLCMLQQLSAQSFTLTGTVKDSKGEVIIGATVMKSSTKDGTITDINGNFSVSTQVGEVLTISFVGYESQKVKVEERKTLNVVLVESAIGLNEVQIIAYGQQDKKTVTGAVSSVKAETILKTPTASVTNAIAGTMPGITSVQNTSQPGASDAQLFIRGSSSLSDDASAQPLILVDGVERTFSDIDPNEIQDITILKDASSTAVFGVRGANGVILVTTRRGAEGRAKISVSSNVSLQSPTRLVEMSDSYTNAMMYNSKLDNDGSSKARFSDYALEAYRTGSDPVIYPNTDWRDYMFNDYYMQTQHNINISGGTKRVKYFTSLGYLYQDGILKEFEQLDYDNTFGYNRYNYRANLDIKITKTSELKINLGGVVGKKKEPIGHGDGLWRMVTWAVPFSSPGLSKDGYVINVPTNYIPVWGKNGLDAFYGRGNQSQTNSKLNLDLVFQQKLDFVTKGLKFTAKASYNTNNTIQVRHTTSTERYTAYYEGTKTTPGLALDDPNFNKNIIYEVYGNNSYVNYNENYPTKARNWYAEASLNYNRTFKKHHKVSALFLYNQNRQYYPGSYGYIPYSYAGLVGRSTYNYKMKYIFDFNIGYNGSENFAPGKTRFGVFPAGSVGWVISEEDFMKQQKIISYLKVRASYGIVGNDKIGGTRFMYMPSTWSVDGAGYNFGVNTSKKLPAANEGVIGNPGVTWETVTKQNYGIESKFFENKLSIGVDRFKEVREDILIQRNNTPDLVSLNMPLVNLGELENKGYELDLRWNHRINELRYYINANVSYAKNRIIFKDELLKPNDFNYETGRSTGLTYGYEFERFYTTDDFSDDNHTVLIDGLAKPDFGNPRPGDCKYTDKDGDGDIDVDDQTYLGYSSQRPEYTYGLNYGVEWKGFNLSMQWLATDNVSRNLALEYRIPFSNSGNRALFQYHADNAWTEETASTATLPRLSDTSKQLNYSNSSLWVKDASYIRLKNIQIGYTMRKNRMLKTLGMQSMKIYLSGYNLLTFDDLKFVDPEAHTWGQRSNQYPVSKIYTMGVNMNF